MSAAADVVVLIKVSAKIKAHYFQHINLQMDP